MRRALISEKLADDRSKKVLLVSHCILNQNTRYLLFIGDSMKAEFTAIIEPAPEGGYRAICTAFGEMKR